MWGRDINRDIMHKNAEEKVANWGNRSRRLNDQATT